MLGFKSKFNKKGHVFPLNPFPGSRKHMGIPLRRLHQHLPKRTRLMFSNYIHLTDCYCSLIYKKMINKRQEITMCNIFPIFVLYSMLIMSSNAFCNCI